MAATLKAPPMVSACPSSATPTIHKEFKAMVKSPHISLLENSKTMKELTQLHCDMMKKGLCRKASYVNKLISACVEMGTYESLSYARNTIALFNDDEGILGSLFMYNCLLRGACSKAMAISEGIQVHGVVIKTGLEKDLFVRNSLIHLYAECGEIELGRKVFDKMLERNVVSWTSLINGYAGRDSAKEAVSLFFEMVEAGVEPNSVTMVCVISACAKLKDLGLGKRVCAYIGELGVKLNTHMVNALVDMYMKCGDIGSAEQLFYQCADKNLVLYNTIISNYIRHGMARKAQVVIHDMMQQGLRPDRVTLLSAIAACAQLGDPSAGKSSHAYVLRHGLEGWDSISNAIIDMYLKCGKREAACKVFEPMPNKTVVSWNTLLAGSIRDGDLELAWRTFDEIPARNLVSWNTMIGALVQEGMFEEAIELFREMQSKGIKPDSVTMVGIASACGYLGAFDLAKWVYSYIGKNGIHIDLQLGTTLVDMFSRCGDSESAIHVFSTMEKQDVSAWTAAIGAMTMKGNAEGAIELFNEMLEEGVKPDEVVFVALLTACSHGGYVEKGRELFKSMKETYGINPQIVHYGCMVDFLGRAGFLGEALDLIQGMPMEPNDVIWGSLLAACRIHKNVELAQFAAVKITELAPEEPGIHVLLSNIYAFAGKWDDVAKVRLRLKEKGVQKVPGLSSIEVHGMIHEFISDDQSHPEKINIDLMLKEIKCKLAEAGYVPDITNVLLDVDLREKEHLLSRHSEKLAMAFALINTGQGRPIRVVKNLRMCSDCHTFAKLVSKLYNREITVRDNNRYHIFMQGFCSCGDYW
ncbi:pentatricopeptide repeat-containing protein At3g22690 isoform X2 [Prosopis cineraria]|uniref:pentatricopeptide repeat-containing protein At3g22690 isoform X2 n=1 Tax=Prosopis cineraria TaxID=364024 RepID=UPI0024105D3D|nr:pentatricopeptide repeat-containing protein At3g22690 isoform X2 [Prosopis cineraria]